MVQGASVRRILPVVLALAVFCGLGRAAVLQTAPQFTAQALDGETFTNQSLQGRATLIQFWATWCPHCREDQTSLDNIERMFSSRELVVLAVDVGESEAKVKKYLEQNPRDCPVALDESKKIASRFGARGVPYYMLIDREGRIAGTQSGSTSEQGLLALLSRAGLAPGPIVQQMRGSGSANSGGEVSSAVSGSGAGGSGVGGSGVSGAKVIDIPGQRGAIAKPLPKTIFVLTSGERLESDYYTLDATNLHVVVGGEERTIALGALDLKATTAVNRARGVELKIPQSRREVFVAF